MKRLLQIFLGLLLLTVTSCEYEEVTDEMGYKGKARVNPWLAAERFTQRLGHEVISSGSWKNPDAEDAVCFVPSAILSNEGFVGKTGDWIRDGGHLVILVEHADAEWNDWQPPSNAIVPIEPALRDLLGQVGIQIIAHGQGRDQAEVKFLDRTYQIKADSGESIKRGKSDPSLFASSAYGSGRVSVVMDSRIFRSRWIGDLEHASLLRALVEAGGGHGRVLFLRGAGISIWKLLNRHLWPFLIGLALLIIVWLWKNFSRFGPMEPAIGPSVLRGYDHHLEALGDFQWRLDKGTALLLPLRERIIEMGQKLAVRSGRRDEDFFQLLADRAAISRERVFRALTEAAPNDSAVMTQTAADIQRILNAVH